MEISFKVLLGIYQAKLLVPELVKVCKSKSVTIKNRDFKMINYLQGELSGTLSGENALYVWGFMDGYGAAVNVNKPKKKVVSL